MGLEEITAVFEADGSIILVLPRNADTYDTEKGKWELPRFRVMSASEEDYKKSFSDAYGIPKESLRISVLDRPRNFVNFNFRSNPQKVFDCFDLSMVHIDSTMYKSCLFTGKTEAAELLTPEDRNLLNSYL